jgi:hypothetical protein
MPTTLTPGTIANCRSCNEPIVWQIEDTEISWRRRWVHQATKIARCDASEESDWQADRAQPKQFCIQHVDSGSYYDNYSCHRNVTDAELMMCGIHARKKREAMREDEKLSESAALDQTVLDHLEPFIEKLNVFYELDARVHINEYARYGQQRYTGYVVVNPAKLQELLNRIEEEVE